MQTLSPFSRLTGCGLVALATLVGGCATNSAPVGIESPPIEETVFAAQAEPEIIPVARYGRYTLVELAPTIAQRDLLLQVIDVRMPEDARASVGDGLRHVLKTQRLPDVRDGTRGHRTLFASDAGGSSAVRPHDAA